jgi:predicted alpha/beta superfamily hydrolase
MSSTPVEGAALELEYFPPVEAHRVTSKYVAQTYQIQVMRPPQRRGSAAPVPVVYATDGNAVFDLFKSLCWLMQGGRIEWPPFILVTIGYPGDSPVAGELLRGRDLTFAGCPDYFSGLQYLWEGMLIPPLGSKHFGGAEEFQQFIAEELIPFIDNRYGTIHGERTFFGHSAGAGFGFFTLLTRATLFRNYILSSPTLSYHGMTPAGVRYENHDFMLRRVEEFIASGGSLPGIRLHMSVGSEEELDPHVSNWQFTSSFCRMLARLKATPIPGLHLTSELLAGRSHVTALPLAFIQGVQAIFC